MAMLTLGHYITCYCLYIFHSLPWVIGPCSTYWWCICEDNSNCCHEF